MQKPLALSLGIAANLDPFLNIMHIKQQEAGVVLPAYTFSAPLLKQAVEKMLETDHSMQRQEPWLQT